ncbi:MAG: transposase [Thiobacillaceae bacterium]
MRAEPTPRKMGVLYPLYLATSLDAERYPQHLFADLYARRFAVEEAFKFLKRRVLLENFTGRNELAVRQDFHARVLLANLTQLFALGSDRRIRDKDRERQRRLSHQTNRAWALSQIRHYLPRLRLRSTLALVREILHRLASA